MKQQENEREQNAIIALKRSLELDPSHLPSWLALAISHTNENDRAAADNAVEQWMRRNPKYRGLVDNFFDRSAQLNGGTLDSLNATRRHTELVDCLVAVVRAGNGEVDADVQIALAVLLNTSEEYVKAQDCFKTALAVRPDVSISLFSSVPPFIHRPVLTYFLLSPRRIGNCTTESAQL